MLTSTVPYQFLIFITIPATNELYCNESTDPIKPGLGSVGVSKQQIQSNSIRVHF